MTYLQAVCVFTPFLNHRTGVFYMAEEKLSPMMSKYLQTKEEYPDCILFYRLGDFYEMFFDDAKTSQRNWSLR